MSGKGGKRLAPHDQLRADIESISGLPCPPHGAPDENALWVEHEVAANFLIHMRGAPDPHVARIKAANFTLQNPVHPVELLRPHIERGLGRMLTEAEFKDRILFD